MSKIIKVKEPTKSRIKREMKKRRKFRAMIFQGLDRSHKWRSDMRDFQQGDIVLLKQETAAAASYRLGLVGEVYPSLSDGSDRDFIFS